MSDSTIYQILKIKEELAKRSAKKSLVQFTAWTKQDYDVNWHHFLLCDRLDKFIKGDIKRMLVFMPPQHGKSELVSRRLPAYLLGINPKLKIIGASYSSDLAQSFNRDVQRIIDSPEYYALFPDTYLNGSNVRNDPKGGYLRNADIFETVGHKGFYKSVGVGGSLTGTPADIAIIDDPVKDAIEANSPTYRDRTWSWYTDVLSTRLHNDSKVLITQTRWHEDDLSGRVLKAMEKTGEHWDVLSLPAVKTVNGDAEDNRQIGEALWESRHSLHRLQQVRTSSPRTFESLYQQEPKPVKTGGEFYHSFDTNKHIVSEGYDADKPLHFTWDFNVMPYVTVNIWQITEKRAVQIDEILACPPYNNTAAACKLVIDKFGEHQNGVIIYGDPAGKHKDTRSEKGWNDYDIIRDRLRTLSPQFKIASAAPPLVVRGVFINKILSECFDGVELLYNSSCSASIEDMQYCKQAADGTKSKDKVRNDAGQTYEKYGHTSDANDYFICEAFKSSFNYFKKGKKEFNYSVQSQSQNKLRY